MAGEAGIREGMTMELLSLLNYGMPVLVLGMLVLLVRIDGRMKDIADDVLNIKKSITWGDTCNERHKDIGRRLNNLERSTGLNGKEAG